MPTSGAKRCSFDYTIDNKLYVLFPFFFRSTSRIGEREAPDGEEEESSRQPTTGLRSSSNVTTPEGHIRVPPWIDHPPVSSLTVVFKDRAIVQLNQLGSEVGPNRPFLV